MELKHWVERIADNLKKMDIKEHIIASGTSISGAIHIGNSCDVFIANAISRSLIENDIKAKTVWVADDHDPLR
ncbi:MAG: lysyl-tRNA synthetase, class, partial [Methanobacteriaceae archaeon]|nr:lysyl-tRNA synthetase, class [Methanobacteriaceae archaeon]